MCFLGNRGASVVVDSYTKQGSPVRGDLFVETNAKIENSSVGAACNMPMLKKHEMWLKHLFR